jgi:hypothetical protein
MSSIQRKSSVSKAPPASVIETLSAVRPSAAEPPAPLSTPAVEAEEAFVRRPGPGRPRSKRRMEPFSSKVEISLRDRLDAYLQQNGMTVVDFLDEAIRDRLEK